MGWVDKGWTAEIEEISNAPEFMNTALNIVDPTLVTTTWNIDTNTPTVTGSGVIARGIPGRVSWPLRPVRDPGTATGDGTVVITWHIIIPWSAYSGPLRTGLLIVFTAGGDNPDLLRYVFRIDDISNASASASRGLKCSIDGESASNSVATAAYY